MLLLNGLTKSFFLSDAKARPRHHLSDSMLIFNPPSFNQVDGVQQEQFIQPDPILYANLPVSAKLQADGRSELLALRLQP